MKVHVPTIHKGKKKNLMKHTNFEQKGLLNEHVATVNKGNK